MVDGNEPEEQDGPDRLLIRPYIQSTEDTADRLPEGGSPPAAVDPTAELPLPPEPAPVPPPAPAPEPAVDGSQDRRQMAWLVGAGLALVLAVGVTIVALWPGSGEDPSVAAPPGGFPWPARPGSAAPDPSAASQSASVRSSPTPSTSSSAPTAASPAPPSAPPPSLPPSATLAPPPTADRVGPITGPGGDCLDVTTGIVLPGTAVAVRDCNGTLSQRWTVATDGTLRVSGSCAAATGAGQVAVGVCGDAVAAQWRSGAGGTLVNVGSGQCLTGPADGNRVRVTPCGADGQTWTLP